MIQSEPEGGGGARIQVGRAVIERSPQQFPDLNMRPGFGAVGHLDTHSSFKGCQPRIDIGSIKDRCEPFMSVQKQGQSELALGHPECG
jgi:hypothetical protein